MGPLPDWMLVAWIISFPVAAYILVELCVWNVKRLLHISPYWFNRVWENIGRFE